MQVELALKLPQAHLVLPGLVARHGGVASILRDTSALSAIELPGGAVTVRVAKHKWVASEPSRERRGLPEPDDMCAYHSAAGGIRLMGFYGDMPGTRDCRREVYALREPVLPRPHRPDDPGRVHVWCVAGSRDPLQIAVHPLQRKDFPRDELQACVELWYETARLGVAGDGPLGEIRSLSWRKGALLVEVVWGEAGGLTLDYLAVCANEFDRKVAPLREVMLGSDELRGMDQRTRIARPWPARDVVVRNGFPTPARDYGDTQLLVTIAQGQFEAADRLLDVGADPNAANWEGHTPMHWVVIRPGVPLLGRLMELGGDVHVVARDGETPLLMACANGMPEVAEILLGHGADPNAQEHEAGQTPLHRAATLGEANLCRLLLEAGAETHTTDHTGWTPLHAASAYDRPEVVAFLLQHGADPNARDRYGTTALHLAARKDTADVVRLLLDAGADTQTKDSLIRKTPLGWALDRGIAEVVSALQRPAQGEPLGVRRLS